MDYIGNNKAAWEEAFDHKQEGWGEENDKRLLNEDLPFFCFLGNFANRPR